MPGFRKSLFQNTSLPKLISQTLIYIKEYGYNREKSEDYFNSTSAPTDSMNAIIQLAQMHSKALNTAL